MGGGAVWTDAIYPLSDYLETSKPQVVYINDWGILNVVRLLTEGQVPLQVGSDPLNKPSFDESRRILLDRISESRAVFVTHTDQNEMFKGVNAKLQTLATEAGYRREIVAEIADRNGRTIFEVFRLPPLRNGPTPHL